MTDAPLGTARPAKHASIGDRFKAPAEFGSLLKPVTKDPDTEDAPAAGEPVTGSAPADEPTEAPVDPATPAVPGAGEEPKPESDPAPAKPKSQRSTRKAATMPAAPTTTLVEQEKADQPIQVSLPKSLHERLLAYKSKEGLSHPTILFDAIESTYDRLPELLAQRTVKAPAAAGGKSLFNRPQAVVRKTEDSDEPRETFIIRVTATNKEILDNLVPEVGAPNRNVMLVAAYDAFLPTD